MKDGKFEIGDIVTVIGPGPTLNWEHIKHTLEHTRKIIDITREGHYDLENGFVYDPESLKLSPSNFSPNDCVFLENYNAKGVVQRVDSMYVYVDVSGYCTNFACYPESLRKIDTTWCNRAKNTTQCINNPKEASIEYEKLWIGNTKCIKILKINNVLSEDETPTGYIGKNPSFCLLDREEWAYYMQRIFNGSTMGFGGNVTGNGIIWWGEDFLAPCTSMMFEGDIIPYDTFMKIVNMMKEAGECLHQINKKNREEEKKKKWSGTAVQTI